MSSAYCMTCNDQVLDLAGACPEGHPIGGEDTSPEPWVGHANAAGTSAPAPPSPPPPPVAQPIAQALNGNGHGNGHDRAHGEPAPAPQVRSFTPSVVDEVGGRAVHRAPATGEAADELAAMLASALSSSPANDDPATNHVPPAATDSGTGTSGDLDGPWVGSAGSRADEPAEASEPALSWTDADLDEFLSATTSGTGHAVGATSAAPSDHEAAASDADWADLASLAAELQLDGPMASSPAEDLTPPPPPAPAVPAPGAPTPGPSSVPANDASVLDALSDQDLAGLYGSAAGQHLDEAEHVPSPPAPPPAPEAAAAPAATVDLANFTARGNSVARNSAAARRFGRKR